MIKFKTVTNNLDPDRTFTTYATTKLTKLEKLIKDGDATAHVELSKIGKNYALVIVLVVNNLRPNIKEQTYVSIENTTLGDSLEECTNKATASLKKQITKTLDKHKN